MKNNKKLIWGIIGLLYGMLILFLTIKNYSNIILAVIPLVIYLFVKKSVWTILFIVFINENFFYLPITLNQNILTLLLIIFTGIISFIHVIKNGHNGRYKKYIILIVFIVLLEILIANFYSGQSIMNGFITSIGLFKYIYYFYFYIIIIEKGKANNVIDLIICLGSGAAILYVLQAILYSKIIIFNMAYFERAGRVRFYTGIILIIFACIFSMERYSDTKKKRYLFTIIICLFEIIFVGQTRSIILPLVGVFIIKIIKLKKITIRSIFNIYLISTMLIFIFIFNSDNYIFNMINSVTTELSTKTGTSGFRLNEIDFYLKGFYESPILGKGLYYDGNEIGYYILGRQYKYYQNDIGILGSIFSFGIVGISIFFSIIFKTRKMIRAVYKFGENKFLSSDIITLFIILSLPFFFYLDSGPSITYIMISICYLEYKYKILISKRVIK